MGFSTIAILSPGNMGSAVGGQLNKAGYRVISCLDERSEYTQVKAREAGFLDVGPLEKMVNEADLILSILDPGKAVIVAKKVEKLIYKIKKKLPFVDCNATSPATALKLKEMIEGAGGIFIDVGIIGGAPTTQNNFPIFCTSGPHASLLDELDGKGMFIKLIGPQIGQGSAIKICNGAFNKGAFALYTSVMLAAEHFGFTDFLRERLPKSQAGNVEKLDEAIIRLPTLAERYVGEMEQVAETFESIGLTPQIHQGAADLFKFISSSPLARQRRDDIDPMRTSTNTLKQLVLQKQDEVSK